MSSTDFSFVQCEYTLKHGFPSMSLSVNRPLTNSTRDIQMGPDICPAENGGKIQNQIVK